MNPILQTCLLSILQRGITEARSSALCGDSRKAAELLDALDNIPRHLHAWTDDSEQEIAAQLAAFRQAWPDHETDYVDLLTRRGSTL